MFTTYPFPYVTRARKKFDATVFTGIEKVNDLEIHEHHALEIQHDRQLLIIDLPLQFIEMLRLQSTAEADEGLVPVGYFFNPQCHWRYR